MMRKDNYQDFQGNDQYEGFCVDMLREVADILKFSFRIKLVDDGLYGAPEPNGSWTGMVGELINRVRKLPQPLSVSQLTRDTKLHGSWGRGILTNTPTRRLLQPPGAQIALRGE